MGKRRKQSGTTGKHSSPRRGEKTKQTKVTQAKEMETKGARQTKLAFAATGTPENTSTTTNAQTQPTVQQAKLSFASAVIGTPTNTKVLKTPAITPEVAAKPNRLLHPTPPTTPERNKTDPPTEQEKNTQDKTPSTDDDNKKPAAKKRIKTVTHEVPTKPSTKPPPVPKATDNTAPKYRAIRYNGGIETPPSDKPFETFLALLKVYFQIIQDVLGKEVHIAAWDSEQEKSFPSLKKPSKLPVSRETLGIYLGTYVNPKPEGSRVFLNLRLMTTKPHFISIEKFGEEIAPHFANSKHKLTIGRQPRPCQAAKSECVGWLMYSGKSMNSDTFVPEIKLALNIPAYVEIGVQYRAIANETGKRPKYNKDETPAAALHLDMDEKYALVYQSRAASLWRKNSKKRLPNLVQLRLVPCFTSAAGKSMTDTQRSDAKTLTERQYYFVKEHLKVLQPYFFISQLDTPLSPENPLTLRRAMMSQAPTNQPTSRLIHNVDLAWKQTAKYSITTVIGREAEAQRFIASMIPEFLHRYGDEATKWFTSSGLLVYQDVKWNAEKGNTTSAKEKDSAEMVKEDPWGLNAKWSEIELTKTTDSNRPDANNLDKDGITTPSEINTTPAQTRLGSDKSIASFGNVYDRTKDDDDTKEEATLAKEAAAKLAEITGTQFEFSTEQLERDREKTLHGPVSGGLSMSTAAKTTPSIRLKLKEAQEEIGELRLALAKKNSPNTETIDSPEVPPEDPEDASNSDPMQTETVAEAKALGSALIDHITEAQAIGSALAEKHREAIQVDSDAMEEDEVPPRPAPLGSLTSSETSSKNKRKKDEMGTEDKSVIELSSNTTSSSESSSSSSSSSTSSSNDSSDKESSDSQNTQELVKRILQNNKQSKYTTPTKNTANLSETSGAPKGPADSQAIAPSSGLRRDHSLSLDPSGVAGGLSQAAGHSD
jgi:hypothetical protein